MPKQKKEPKTQNEQKGKNFSISIEIIWVESIVVKLSVYFYLTERSYL